CVAVELGVHGHRCDPELAACANDTHGDLTPVGDQDLGKHGRMFTAVLSEAANRALERTRFSNVRWVDETGSTNADLTAAARAGACDGTVLVADHQTAGRGRADRVWTAPPGSSLLLSVLLRPSAAFAPFAGMAVGVAATDGIAAATGVQVRLKWPNDL